MKTLELESLGLVQMTESETQMTLGGCGSWWWCPERIVAELGAAGDAFMDGMKSGYEAFNVH